MVAGQAILAACCVLLGVSTLSALSVIQPIVVTAFGVANVSGVYNIPMLSIALILTAITAIMYFMWLTGKIGGVKPYVTWECGFGELTGRMQATASSFAENIAYTFAPLLQYQKEANIQGKDRRHFPETVSLEVSTASILELRIYAPAVDFVRWLGMHMLMLQAGSIHLYLSYILVMLVALMVIGILT